MALFAVNRYWGSEQDSPESNKKDKASLILEKLKADAEKRRLQRNEVKSGAKDNKDDEGNLKKSRKRSKSQSLHAESETKNQFDNEGKERTIDLEKDQDQKEQSRSRKKRRKKRNETAAEENEVKDEVKPADLSEDTRRRLQNTDITDQEEVMESNGESGNDDKELHDDKATDEIGGYTVIGNFTPKQHEKVKRVLPGWLASPNVVSADIAQNQTPISQVTGLHPIIIKKLTENGIQSFFPVQSQVIPAMLSSLRSGYQVGPGGYQPSDICCSAPTGSGKTLAFVIPLVQALLNRVVCQIRALVILPVQDLARQVFGVFNDYCQGTNVKVGLIIGQKSFQSEQQSLVRKRQSGYHSQFDIVVATPGRLVDHINKTTGFDLRHLRFLVIDEADRMMSEVKQDWLSQVEQAVYTTKYGNGLYPEFTRPQPGPVTVANSSKLHLPLQKLLFSATLSQNPERLQELKLFQPKLFTSVQKTQPKTENSINMSNTMLPDTEGNTTLNSGRVEFEGKYTTPVGLTEHFVESFSSEKPLVVLHFLINLGYRQVLCFTNSIEATHRLYLLIRQAGGIEVKEFSSQLHASKRKRILQQFKAGKIDVLICSDAMARGMDVENVKYVISYDSPTFIKTYIHRVGRTARAGKTGTALTLLERKEVFHFKKMLREAGKTDIKELKISKSDLEKLVPKYQDALRTLPVVLESERRSR